MTRLDNTKDNVKLEVNGTAANINPQTFGAQPNFERNVD